MLGPQHLAPAAQRQLAAWEALARTWEGELDLSDHQIVVRCKWCGRGVILATDTKAHRYRYTEEQKLALIVLHLRNHHEDLDPDR